MMHGKQWMRALPQTVLVEIERFDGEPPPVTAFEPPPLVSG